MGDINANPVRSPLLDVLGEALVCQRVIGEHVRCAELSEGRDEVVQVGSVSLSEVSFPIASGHTFCVQN